MIGFPECGNCESTPCQCERDDNDWFIKSTDSKPKSFYKAPEELSIGDYVKVTDTKLFEGLTEEEYSKAYRITDIALVQCDNAELYYIEIEGPMSKYMLTNLSVKKVHKSEEININQLKEKTMVDGTKNQQETLKEIDNIFKLFKGSNGTIRPHFIVVGPSGAGKTFNIQRLTNENNLKFVEINAAQLTKEGTSGASLSKVLGALQNNKDQLTVCFIEEWDKLFISGNNNSCLAHETTNGVQNEFLKVLESNKASIAGDYGKYMDISVEKVLFVFAGAFNGEPDITIDRLRDFGIKTEFIGRVGLVYNLEKLTLDQLLYILRNSTLLEHYINLHDGVDKEQVISKISEFIEATYEQNTLGARLVNTLIHQYFIKKGQLGLEQAKEISFQKKLSF